MPIDGRDPVKIFGAPEDLTIPGLNTYLVSPMVDISGDEKLVLVGQTFDKPPEIYISNVDSFKPQKN